MWYLMVSVLPTAHCFYAVACFYACLYYTGELKKILHSDLLNKYLSRSKITKVK